MWTHIYLTVLNVICKRLYTQCQNNMSKTIMSKQMLSVPSLTNNYDA